MEKQKVSFVTRWMTKIQNLVNYCWSGVWKETRDTRGIRTIKVINLSVRSFFDRDLQAKSMALTYSTVLAIVPAFALLFAIGRGFGFQNLLEDTLYKNFPAQKQSIEFALKFVDSYLAEASQGVFVGVGILFLLWTLISLLSNIETVFNRIWDIKQDRSMYQKVTDYIAICLFVPVLMICSSGASIFMSATIQDNLHFAFLTPVLNIVLEASPLILSAIAFSLSFFLIPNTKVKFKYALISGAVCAVIFYILQLLFLSGQIYVSKYNAIYGSFAFLPLMLIWMQLSWLLVLFGCGLTYSLQNVLSYNFIGELKTMSGSYAHKVSIILMAAIVNRFRDGKQPLTRPQLSFYYDIPIRVVTNLCELFNRAKLVNYVVLSDDRKGIAPATETSDLTVGEVLRRIDMVGDSDFIPRFGIIYKNELAEIDSWLDKSYDVLSTHLIRDIKLPVDDKKEDIVNTPPASFIKKD